MKKESLGLIQSNITDFGTSGIHENINLKIERPKLLLHSCCGPCSTACIERLMDDYEITVFFYNPNITDFKEYEMRLDAQKKVIDRFNDRGAFMLSKIGLLEGEYCPSKFIEFVSGMEDEPEGGKRCERCFDMRLSETARNAQSMGYDMFATTLTVSPHKNYSIISAIGNAIGKQYGVAYLDMDFKKKAGFQRSIELSREFGLYRQNYCGCEFSKWFLK